ncbi:helix-turn-helix transcriptional regulator [Micromonospora sp. NBC_01813]|uniref:helix-turn-helix transcriptional regulator n=1 Tax=Micromonospora sp. NBC_01813 TaxID=2975988 RepID=UPI002DDB6388|nr:AAA family ATPase [Micromonospora sp. NBC_01813]WSA07383.1 AAA family ATPase [Micromonospora sp. NBC_01813]
MPAEAEFIGRTDQLELLARRLTDARQGHARTVLIGGEAGIGKSRLLSRFAESARAAGAHVLSGAGEEHFGDPMPYGPLLEVLDSFGREYGESRAAVLGGDAYERLIAFFELGADSMTAPQQVFLAVRRMLDGIAADAPVVLILEDLHWADPSTLDLVRHLGQTRAENRRLLLVASFRSGGLVRDDPLWQLLASPTFLRRTERLELPAFTLPELRRFINSAANEAVDPELIERCLEWSDGIPFYAEQLMATGVLDNPEDVRLPADISSVVLARLGGLGKDALRVLRVAAVAGRAMSRRLLRTVSGLPGEALRDALQECFDRQMLVTGHEEDVYRFRHALLREVVYQMTVRDTRVDLHMAMAQALAEDSRLCLAEGSAVAEQASHWYQAGMWPQALSFAVQAGETAARTLAFASAEVQFTRALKLWQRVADPQLQAGMSRDQVLLWAAEAARWTGHVDRALAHIRQAIAEVGDGTDPGRLGELYERRGTYLWEVGRRADSVAALRQASALLEAGPASAVKARVLAGFALAHLQAGRYADGHHMAAAALTMARDVGARAEEGRALNISGLALGMLGDPEGEVRLRAALEIARSVDHIEDLLRAYGNLGLVLEHAGRTRESASAAMSGLAEARKLHLANTRQGGVLANNASAALLLLGEWEEAEKIVTEVSSDRRPEESLYPRLTLAEIKVARGEHAQARELLVSIDNVEHGKDPRFLGPLHAVRAELALWQDDFAGAAEEVERGLAAVQDGENGLEVLRLCVLGLRCAADRAAASDAYRAVAITVGDRLALLARQAEQSQSQSSVAGPAGGEVVQLVRLCKAERRRLRAADSATVWGEVAAGWVKLDRPYPAAYARWRQAVAAHAAGDRDAARQRAREAYLVAKSLGAGPLCDVVVELARKLDLDLADRPAATKYPYDLTPAELDTLRLLCEGYGPARIAAARTVVIRTVQTQLGSVYRKLGVHSSVEAVALANRERLFD